MSDFVLSCFPDLFCPVILIYVCQGPLPDTVEDFWHMVWVEGCDKIVMLTNLCEGGKVCNKSVCVSACLCVCVWL